MWCGNCRRADVRARQTCEVTLALSRPLSFDDDSSPVEEWGKGGGQPGGKSCSIFSHLVGWRAIGKSCVRTHASAAGWTDSQAKLRPAVLFQTDRRQQLRCPIFRRDSSKGTVTAHIWSDSFSWFSVCYDPLFLGKESVTSW